MEKVSIIIPTYNTPLKYLAQAVDSARNQTVKPHEIIIVDDGSDPGVMFNIEGIKVIRNSKNMGIGYSRKIGVEAATGDYIAFISADDAMEPNMIDTCLEYAKSYPDSIFYSDFSIMDENGAKRMDIRCPEFGNYADFAQACINSARNDRMFTNYNFFAPAKLLKENNFDETLRFGEDLEHLLRCVLKRVNFVHIPFFLFKYRESRNMTTQQIWGQIHENNLKIFQKINSLAGKTIL